MSNDTLPHRDFHGETLSVGDRVDCDLDDSGDASVNYEGRIVQFELGDLVLVKWTNGKTELQRDRGLVLRYKA